MKYILLLFFSLFFICNAHADFQQNVQGGNAYNYKFTSAPTVINVVKAGAGILHTLTIEGGNSSTVNIYDYSSAFPAAQIAGFTTTNALATYLFDVSFSSGCTVTTNGTLQYTVSYL